MNTKEFSNRNDSATADEVLVAFSQAGPEADLAEWTRRYPAQARDLARLAAERWCAGPDADARYADAAAEARLREAGLSSLRALCAARTTPLTNLLGAAEAKGLDLDTLATRLSLTEAYVVKLHRRLFAPESLPRTLVRELADVLGRAANDVQAYLAGPPRLAAGAAYRSDSAPSVGEREDFRATLLADPELSETQRARYLSEDDAEDAA